MMVLAFSSRPIAFHRELAIALGGIYEALMFQQLAYWSDFGDLPDGWIYKTGADFREETTMTRYQLDKARANLVRLGVIEAKLRGVPATMHYRVKWERLYEVLQGDDAPESGAAPQFVEGQQTRLAKVTKLPVDGQQASLPTVSKLDRRPPANPKRNKDHTETTQRESPPRNAFEDRATPAALPATPEERLAHFEATEAAMRRMRGLG